jgi:hypothetical protein
MTEFATYATDRGASTNLFNGTLQEINMSMRGDSDDHGSPLLVLTQSKHPKRPKEHKLSNGANNNLKLNSTTKNYPPVNFLIPIAIQQDARSG